MSLAILAVTLVTAFNIANLSYSEGMQAREHTQAIYLAQAQAERLIMYRDTLVDANSTPATIGNPILNPASFDNCNTQCHMNSGTSAPVADATDNKVTLFNGVEYTVEIKPFQGSSVIVPPPGDTAGQAKFAISVTWDSAVSTDTGRNRTEINLFLADTRNIVPRDCSLAGDTRCI